MFFSLINQPALQHMGRGIISILLLIAVVRCDNPASSVIGVMQLRLTSQSVPQEHVRSVFITISRVSARSKGALTYDFSNTSPRIFDLFELRDGNTRVLDLLSLPAGVYDAVRMNISDVTVELTNSRQFITNFPDSQNVVVDLMPLNPVTVKGGRLSDTVIDFDLLRSLTPQGDVSHVNSITGYLFTPTARFVNLTTVGEITGLVKHDNGTPSLISDDVALNDYPITVIQPGRTDSVSVFSDAAGEYVAFFMPAGTYSLMVPPTDTTMAWSADDVVVTTANPTRRDVTATRQ